ncbi:MAG TPA: ribonuclease HI family protein [Patescibacteria group bacterium]|nr:ribonuclease HI family protein [Patescibacteria group bacterium]
MENLGTLLHLVAGGKKLREVWEESGFTSMGEARRALEALAAKFDTGAGDIVLKRKGTAPPSHDASRRSDTLIIYTDGASRGNPGPASIAAVVYLPSGKLLISRSSMIGTATNNVAEYRAVLDGLELARNLHAVEIEIKLDSELVVRQLNGEYRVKNKDLRILHDAVLAEMSHFARCTFEHISRAQNTEADRLANEALDSPTGDH